MKFIDTHSHLYSAKFDHDMDETIDRAKQVLSHIFLPNIDLESIEAMQALTARDPSFFYPMVGLHPCSVKEDYEAVLTRIEEELEKGNWYGVGETGLDYYWDKTFIEEQKTSLRRHIDWAKAKDLPLILHCRDSMDDVIELVKEGQDGSLRGIFHCFNGTEEQGKRILDTGFLLGIGGVITFKNAGVDKVVKNLPLDSMVLETDSPYLAPVPYRGKRNESAYTRIVAVKLSDVKGIDLQEVAEITSGNAKKLFFRPG